MNFNKIDTVTESNVNWLNDGETANASNLNRPIKQISEIINNNLLKTVTENIIVNDAFIQIGTKTQGKRASGLELFNGNDSSAKLVAQSDGNTVLYGSSYNISLVPKKRADGWSRVLFNSNSALFETDHASGLVLNSGRVKKDALIDFYSQNTDNNMYLSSRIAYWDLDTESWLNFENRGRGFGFKIMEPIPTDPINGWRIKKDLLWLTEESAYFKTPVSIETSHGTVTIGSQNEEWSHFYTNSSKYFFDKPIWIGNQDENNLGGELLHLGNIGRYAEQIKTIVLGTTSGGTSYSAGNGLILSGTTFSLDPNIATKSYVNSQIQMIISSISTTSGTTTSGTTTSGTTTSGTTTSGTTISGVTTESIALFTINNVYNPGTTGIHASDVKVQGDITHAYGNIWFTKQTAYYDESREVPSGLETAGRGFRRQLIINVTWKIPVGKTIDSPCKLIILKNGSWLQPVPVVGNEKLYVHGNTSGEGGYEDHSSYDGYYVPDGYRSAHLYAGNYNHYEGYGMSSHQSVDLESMVPFQILILYPLTPGTTTGGTTTGETLTGSVAFKLNSTYTTPSSDTTNTFPITNIIKTGNITDANGEVRCIGPGAWFGNTTWIDITWKIPDGKTKEDPFYLFMIKDGVFLENNTFANGITYEWVDNINTDELPGYKKKVLLILGKIELVTPFDILIQYRS